MEFGIIISAINPAKVSARGIEAEVQGESEKEDTNLANTKENHVFEQRDVFLAGVFATWIQLSHLGARASFLNGAQTRHRPNCSMKTRAFVSLSSVTPFFLFQPTAPLYIRESSVIIQSVRAKQIFDVGNDTREADISAR